MSLHCCNRFCELDEEFCRVQKDLLDYNGDMSDRQAYDFLMERVSPELQKKLRPATRKTEVCPHCWGPLP